MVKVRQGGTTGNEIQAEKQSEFYDGKFNEHLSRARERGGVHRHPTGRKK
jgi:hypothetical protein